MVHADLLQRHNCAIPNLGENGMVGRRWIVLVLLAVCFMLLVVSISQAYSYNDYYRDEVDRWDEEEESADDALSYYDYAGQRHEIPEPDPYLYGHHRGCSPGSMMLRSFIIFLVLFWLWLVYVMARGKNGN